jgi:hypothetical protein
MATTPSDAPVGVPEPQIKGSGIQPFLAWYAERHGAERLAGVARRIPPERRACFDLDDAQLGVLPSAWYPASAIHGLLDSVGLGLSPAERRELAREGARAIMGSNLKGVYRWLFQTMMSPERYARNAQKLFSRYYDTGTMEKSVLPGGGHLSVVSGWAAHHPFLCDLIQGTAECVYAELGCRDVQVRRTSCVAEGATDCRFEIRWS